MARPGPVSVTFGTPMRLSGDDYAALAQQVEQAVRDLPISARQRDTITCWARA